MSRREETSKSENYKALGEKVKGHIANYDALKQEMLNAINDNKYDGFAPDHDFVTKKIRIDEGVTETVRKVARIRI